MMRPALLALVSAGVMWGQAAPAAPAREPGLYATINTSMGAITAKLYEKEAPITVRNFVALSRGGKQWIDPKTKQPTTRPLYSGTIFHRVIPGFMVQGGDPTGTGMGDGGLKHIPDEFFPTLKFDQPGRLAMANSGPGTGTCQFFITEVPTPHLNGLHTIFGQVIEGQDLVPKMTAVAKKGDKPITPIRIVNIVIKREGPEPERPKPAPAMKKAAPITQKASPPPAAAAKK